MITQKGSGANPYKFQAWITMGSPQYQWIAKFDIAHQLTRRFPSSRSSVKTLSQVELRDWKALLAWLPILNKPSRDEISFVYLAVTARAAILVLVRADNSAHQPFTLSPMHYKVLNSIIIHKKCSHWPYYSEIKDIFPLTSHYNASQQRLGIDCLTSRRLGNACQLGH